MYFFKKYYINTTDEVDVIAITHELKYAIADSKAPEGLVTAITPFAGASIVIMPALDEAIDELKATIDVFGSEAGQTTDKLKRDRSVSAIIQSAVFGRTMSIPFQNGKIILDPYDEVFLLDFENKGSRRELIVQVASEAPKEEAAAKGRPPQKAG